MASKWIYIVLAILGGICIAPQGAINAMLGRNIGPLQAALVSFAVGFVTLLICVVVFYGRFPGDWAQLPQAPRYAFTGGILGAIIVFTSLLAVPRIGATATVVAILIGQVLSSALMDRYGWFGVPVSEFDPWRLLGLALLAISIPLVVR